MSDLTRDEARLPCSSHEEEQRDDAGRHDAAGFTSGTLTESDDPAVAQLIQQQCRPCSSGSARGVIPRHLQEIARAFRSGDFTTPAFVHMRQVPGTEIMAARRDAIAYTYHDLARGGDLRMVTQDREALVQLRRPDPEAVIER